MRDWLISSEIKFPPANGGQLESGFTGVALISNVHADTLLAGFMQRSSKWLGCVIVFSNDCSLMW